jgi:hypothetical protein
LVHGFTIDSRAPWLSPRTHYRPTKRPSEGTARVPELQARCLEVVGRPTGSTNKAYLIWKIREAQKGRIPLGPRKNAHREGVTFKVLPLRMESTVVDKLDEAWRSRGIKNRMEFFRGALGHYLKQLGAEDPADPT